MRCQIQRYGLKNDEYLRMIIFDFALSFSTASIVVLTSSEYRARLDFTGRADGGRLYVFNGSQLKADGTVKEGEPGLDVTYAISG